MKGNVKMDYFQNNVETKKGLDLYLKYTPHLLLDFKPFGKLCKANLNTFIKEHMDDIWGIEATDRTNIIDNLYIQLLNIFEIVKNQDFNLFFTKRE
jgi:hypothetical protein